MSTDHVQAQVLYWTFLLSLKYKYNLSYKLVMVGLHYDVKIKILRFRLYLVLLTVKIQ